MREVAGGAKAEGVYMRSMLGGRVCCGVWKREGGPTFYAHLILFVLSFVNFLLLGSCLVVAAVNRD